MSDSEHWRVRVKKGRRRFLVTGAVAVVAWVARGARDSALSILFTELWTAATRRPEPQQRAIALQAEQGLFEEVRAYDVVTIGIVSATLEPLTVNATGTVTLPSC